jgi:hypothetical protein
VSGFTFISSIAMYCIELVYKIVVLIGALVVMLEMLYIPEQTEQ